MSAAFFLPILVFVFCGIDLLILATGDTRMEVHGASRRTAMAVDVVLMCISLTVTVFPYLSGGNA